ncbi:MAG TPA: ABC transporter permease, partial [Longimicrobiales bacterium]|nr:ABC transporter permease [Longimicrobiales bacterium]
QLQHWGHTLGEPGQSERARTMRITPSFLDVLGTAPLLGRNFVEEETREGEHRRAILSWGYWQERYAGDRAVIGRELRVDGEPYTIVGVLPRSFRLPDAEQPRVYVPIPYAADAESLENWHSNNFAMLARLRPGSTIEQARAQSDALNARLTGEWPVPNGPQLLKDAGFHTQIHPFHEELVRDIRATLWLLWAGVAFVMLIGCVNIANIMIARAQARVRDVATRLALGASTLRLGREILTHSVLLALLGGAAGIAVAVGGIRLLQWLGADQFPRGTEIGLDGVVLLYTFGLAALGGLLFGAIPLFQLTRRDLRGVLQSESRGATANRRAIWVRSALVTAQVSLAFLLLIGAGLLLESFRAAQSVYPGFRDEGLWSGFVSLPEARYPDGAARGRFVDELLSAVAEVPGVERVAVTTQLPFTGNNSSSVILPEGYVPPAGESLLSPRQSWVSPGYFETLAIPVLRGRTFTDLDGRDGSRTIILDEWLARRYFGEESPLGKRMLWGAVPGMAGDTNYYTIIGVVGVVKHHDLTASASEHVGAYYFPYRTFSIGYFSVAARSALSTAEALTPAVRERMRQLDAEVPLFQVQSVSQRIADSLRERRSPMVLLLAFAALAVLLAVLGIYGVLAYVVAQQNRELAVRMALGSTAGGVFRLVLGRGLRVTLLGLIIGAGLAAVGAQVIRSLLYGVQPLDPVVYLSVALLLGTVALLACLVPARQAASTEAVRVLGQT